MYTQSYMLSGPPPPFFFNVMEMYRRPSFPLGAYVTNGRALETQNKTFQRDCSLKIKAALHFLMGRLERNCVIIRNGDQTTKVC